MTPTRPTPSASTGSAERREVDELTAALRLVAEVCDRIADGDLEARLDLGDGVPPAVALAAQAALNRLLDVTDAFVRESAASLTSAAAGRYHRRFLVRGMPGAYRQGAVMVNDACGAIREKSDRLTEATATRHRLADDLESTVLHVSEQVAAASTQLQATATGLASFADGTVAEANRAAGTMAELAAASQQISAAVDLIKRVSAQTRLLALNAAIEAARAGVHGKGFAVVADEVKQLADQAARSTATIVEQIAAVRSAEAGAIGALDAITERIREFDGLVEGIAAAVSGSSGAIGDAGGLSRLAELLQVEVMRFLAAVRES